MISLGFRNWKLREWVSVETNKKKRNKVTRNICLGGDYNFYFIDIESEALWNMIVKSTTTVK